MPAQKEVRDTDTGRVVMFPTRSSLAKIKEGRTESGIHEPHEVHVADLRKFEQGTEPDDYGRRMVINVAAFAVIVLLTLAGIWLAEQLALLRKHQDCAFTGRKGCADVDAQTRSN